MIKQITTSKTDLKACGILKDIDDSGLLLESDGEKEVLEFAIIKSLFKNKAIKITFSDIQKDEETYGD